MNRMLEKIKFLITAYIFKYPFFTGMLNRFPNISYSIHLLNLKVIKIIKNRNAIHSTFGPVEIAKEIFIFPLTIGNTYCSPTFLFLSKDFHNFSGKLQILLSLNYWLFNSTTRIFLTELIERIPLSFDFTFSQESLQNLNSLLGQISI